MLRALKSLDNRKSGDHSVRMKRADANYFSGTREPQAWRARGLVTLYGFGVASLIAAVITFIAHNWTYLGTGLKLGGIGAALIICALLWVIKGFDRNHAQSFGIAAQVLIGVWLAAAGQIYQAPGGLQDFLLIWPVLGLPFALASRSPAHWAVWFGIIGMAALSPIGLTLGARLGPEWKAYICLAGGLILSLGLLGSLYTFGSNWLSAALALELNVLLIGASWIALFDPNWLGSYGPSVIAITAVLGLFYYAYHKKRIATAALLISAVPVIGVSVVGDLLADILDADFLFFLIMTSLVCGGTYGLVLVFRHLQRLAPVNADSDLDVRASTDDHVPWYMDALVGAGGVMTAFFACGLIVTVIALSGLIEQNWGVSLFVIGAGVYGLSILMQRRSSGQFTRFLFGTFILVGIFCLTAGFGEILNDVMSAGLLLLALSIITALLAPGDRILSGVMAVSACVATAWITTSFIPRNESTLVLLGIYSVCGLVFGSVVLRGRVYLGVAAVFLIAAITAEYIVLDYRGSDADMSWTVINIALAAVCGAWLWFIYIRTSGPSLPMFIALMVIAVVLPVGAVPAMIMLILAYAVGSRALFLIGIVAMAWFLFSAYFDLSMTLLALSGVMAAVGAGLLGLWAFASKRVEIAS
jgi:uncharacterized membrane protein